MISDLIGLTLINITNSNDESLIFETNTGRHFKMYHRQDCCETVTLNEVIGDLEDLLDTPILVAEERVSSEGPPPPDNRYGEESFTWTFYELRTIKGSVTLRWLGESNGYYSERVDFEEI